MGKLDGRTALVTGGSSGIGLAAAKALANEGTTVYITGRRQQELARAVEQIGKNAVGVQGDIANVGDRNPHQCGHVLRSVRPSGERKFRMCGF
jgi:NAD(P)-dependent dehydrogenase (short-subunit alcohol dehydrogenase family)